MGNLLKDYSSSDCTSLAASRSPRAVCMLQSSIQNTHCHDAAVDTIRTDSCGASCVCVPSFRVLLEVNSPCRGVWFCHIASSQVWFQCRVVPDSVPKQLQARFGEFMDWLLPLNIDAAVGLDTHAIHPGPQQVLLAAFSAALHHCPRQI